ncbi:hypothetical protein PVAND_009961 [Polypedilum vanderplanki]|uniref:Chitin-binding type-2 domain-containing protein n=1 Tax=Polypedilum vanderplanki TaxID=319348 RepID=A0A9J6CEU3_POLVA|nr:hypothetical protein PVAND_009961 [Polypedilum vanderplanki]
MKILIINAVILLTYTQLIKASVDVNKDPEDSIIENEINNENMSEIKDEVYQAIQTLDDNIYTDENTNDEYEGDDDDGEDEMDVDTMEKTLGIEIPICAQYAELTYPLHLSHLTDCGKFYKCSNGRGYLFDCPAGEHWSVKLDRCDYPEIANCNMNGMHQYRLKKIPAKQANDNGDEVNSDNNDDENNFDEELEVDPRCKGSDPFKALHFAHLNDCSKFYKCYMGKAYIIKCPNGQHWGQHLNRCEHPTIARCNVLKQPKASIAAASFMLPYMDIPVKHTILDDPDYVIRDQRCVDDEGDRFNPTHFSHPSDCQMFYKCFNKLAYKVSCPLGLHFNEKTKACDYPHIAKCQSFAAYQNAQQQHIEMSTIPDCSHGKNVNIGIQGSLTRYFQCHSGEAYLRECGEGEFFNVNVMKCDHLPLDPWENRNHIRFPQWPTFTPYYSNNYYKKPMYWGMATNYNNWQYPVYQQNIPHFEDREHKVPAKPNMIEKLPETYVQTNNMPQVPNAQQQTSPEFPNWHPQLSNNIGFSQQQPLKPVATDSERITEGGIDFMHGQFSSHCPKDDDPVNPVHFSHETSCTKFYKCFQQKAFLMECPNEQKWSDELQRCDYYVLSNCDEQNLQRKE